MSDFALLHAFGVFEFFFAEPQHLAVIQPERCDGDEQEGTHDDPQDAPAPDWGLVRWLRRHSYSTDKILTNGKDAGNGTKVLGLSDKRQRCWQLRSGAGRCFRGSWAPVTSLHRPVYLYPCLHAVPRRRSIARRLIC